jgi:hypothetical protein
LGGIEREALQKQTAVAVKLRKETAADGKLRLWRVV